MSAAIRILPSLAKRGHMRGQSLAEFVIVIPVVILLALGILQFALFFIAKSTLNQAAISGVREGIVHNGSRCSIRAGIVKGLAPLYQNAGMQRNLIGYTASLTRAWQRTTLGPSGGLNNVAVQVLNPTPASFQDFASTPNNVLQDGNFITAIPNARLLYRNTNQGGRSKQSIQDANLLSIRVNYCYPVIVPPVRWLTQTMRGNTLFDSACYRAGGVPIQSDATMLMQSAAQAILINQAANACGPP